MASTKTNAELEKKIKKVEKVEEAAGEGKPFDEKAKAAETVEEDVKITDTIGKSDPFKDKAKKVEKVEEAAGEGKPFFEKAKKVEKVEEAKKAKKQLQTEEFNITELDMNSVGSALENAGGEDEVLTMEEIEREISEMENIGEELKGINATSPSYMKNGNKGIAFDELVTMRNKLDEVIKSLNTDDKQVDQVLFETEFA